MKKNANKGFSLVELIIVIAIMAVLIGVLAPQFIKHVENSRQSTDMDNIQSIKTAIEAAVADEDITYSAKITVASTGITYTATKGATGGESVTLEGVAATTPLKSKGWDLASSKEYVYNLGTYTWSGPSCTNSKNTSKGNDLQKIFE